MNGWKLIGWNNKVIIRVFFFIRRDALLSLIFFFNKFVIVDANLFVFFIILYWRYFAAGSIFSIKNIISEIDLLLRVIKCFFIDLFKVKSLFIEVEHNLEKFFKFLCLVFDFLVLFCDNLFHLIILFNKLFNRLNI